MHDDHPRGEPGPASVFPHRPGRHVRVVHESAFTPGDVAAFVVALVMVCGPLALGAIGL